MSERTHIIKGIKKEFTDEEFNRDAAGQFFDLSYYTTILNHKKSEREKYDRFEGYYIDENGKQKVLYKLMKNVIPLDLQNDAINSFRSLANTQSANRGLAAGKPEGSKTARYKDQYGQSVALKSRSSIAGYYDKPLREHKKYLVSDVACRETAFTKNNFDKWKIGLPFIQKCSKIYQQNGDSYYKMQKKEMKQIPKEMQIPNTVFTTVTINFNNRTACHKDVGDYSKGLGNLIVVGKFEGSYLGFPQFKTCIRVQPGDFLLMDVHQWHCNTELILPEKVDEDKDFRMSFVLYLREEMSKCKNHHLIEDIHYILPEIEKNPKQEAKRKEKKKKEKQT